MTPQTAVDVGYRLQLSPETASIPHMFKFSDIESRGSMGLSILSRWPGWFRFTPTSMWADLLSGYQSGTWSTPSDVVGSKAYILTGRLCGSLL